MIRVECPSCAQVLTAPERAAGKPAMCPMCKARVTLPGRQDLAAVVEERPPAGDAATAAASSSNSAATVSILFAGLAVFAAFLGLLCFGWGTLAAIPVAFVGLIIGCYAARNRVTAITLNCLAFFPPLILAALVALGLTASVTSFGTGLFKAGSDSDGSNRNPASSSATSGSGSGSGTASSNSASKSSSIPWRPNIPGASPPKSPASGASDGVLTAR